MPERYTTAPHRQLGITPVQPPGYQEYDQCDLGMFWGYKIRIKWAHSQLSRWSGTFFRVQLKIVENKCNKTEFESLSLLMLLKIKLNHHKPEKWKMIYLDDVEQWIEVWWIISLLFHCRYAGMARHVLPCSLLKVWFLELNVSSKNMENNFCDSWLTVESGKWPYIWWKSCWNSSSSASCAASWRNILQNWINEI